MHRPRLTRREQHHDIERNPVDAFEGRNHTRGDGEVEVKLAGEVYRSEEEQVKF